MNDNFLIEHIAVSRASDDLFATGAADKCVTAWSFLARKKRSDVSTILSFGGDRLGIVVGRQPVIVAASWRKGAAAYDVTSGKLLWWRRDLKYVQHVQDLPANDPCGIGVGLDKGPYYILDVETGENKSKLSNIIEVYASFFEPLYLLVGTDKMVHLSARLQLPSIWKKPLVSFAILHAAFSPTQVAYSESGGSVYCFDFFGAELWRLEPEFGHHIVRIAWNCVLQKWLAIKWNFQHGGPKELWEIDTAGSASIVASLGDCWQAEFFQSASHVITSNGEVISIATGQSVWRFTDGGVLSDEAGR